MSDDLGGQIAAREAKIRRTKNRPAAGLDSAGDLEGSPY
jgi:hypothetical protein